MVDSGAKKQKKGSWPGSNLLDFAIQMAIGEGRCWDCVYNSAENPIPIGTVKKKRDMGGFRLSFWREVLYVQDTRRAKRRSARTAYLRYAQRVATCNKHINT